MAIKKETKTQPLLVLLYNCTEISFENIQFNHKNNFKTVNKVFEKYFEMKTIKFKNLIVTPTRKKGIF